MTHEFEIREEIALEATPEQVWAAIATGPGIDSWFMGRSEVEEREGGTARMTMMGHTEEATITAWEPGKRYATRGGTNPDGTFMAFEYLIEARDQGSTVLRFVHSGILGDDWQEQYDALREGDPMYLRKLACYLEYFAGRTARWLMFLPGPRVADRARVRRAFASALGLSGEIAEGAAVRLSVDGVAPADGVVAFTSAGSVGVRTGDVLYTLMHGWMDTVVVESHDFAAEGDIAEDAWRSWLDRSFA